MRLQKYLDRFFQNSLSIDVSPTDYGIMDLEGVTFNSNTKMLAVCGGKQVNPKRNKVHVVFPFNGLFNYMWHSKAGREPKAGEGEVRGRT